MKLFSISSVFIVILSMILSQQVHCKKIVNTASRLQGQYQQDQSKKTVLLGKRRLNDRHTYEKRDSSNNIQLPTLPDTSSLLTVPQLPSLPPVALAPAPAAPAPAPAAPPATGYANTPVYYAPSAAAPPASNAGKDEDDEEEEDEEED